ncbi:MAG TPA: malic enzyme-like NAD(P)-binding protein, partial [Ktedonobacterales bacterium]|nr:malic enzyme-like NAD(P)-binding protein [Ktedonobacterales bacterium]
MVTDLARHVERPVILPLSNPTDRSEAAPADLLQWTDGRALVATGSPFDPVNMGGRTFQIGQCNNMFIFPGVGLGVIISEAARVPDALFLAAASALSEMAPARSDPSGALYPGVHDVRLVARHVALAVAREAQHAGVAPFIAPEALQARLDATMWRPVYPHIRHVPA